MTEDGSGRMSPTRSLGKESVFHDLTQAMVDGKMEFLNPGDFGSRSLYGNIRKWGQKSTFPPSQAQYLEPHCPSGFRGPNDVCGIARGAYAHQDVAFLAKGDHLLGKGIFGVVIIIESGVKPDHGGKGESGKSAMQLFRKRRSKFLFKLSGERA